MSVLRAAGFCLLGTCALGGVAQADYEPPIVISNARIVAAPDKVIERGSVLIVKGRIAEIGQTVNAPADALQIDAEGLIVYPGFVDANSHAGITANEPADDDRARWEDESPSVVDGPQSATVWAYRRLMHPHWRTEEIYDPKAAKPEDYRAAGFTTALISPKPAIFSGASAVIELGDVPVRRSVVKVGFAQHSAFITGMEEMRGRRGRERRESEMPQYPTTTMGAMAAFRQILLDSQWHRNLLDWSRRHSEGERPAVDANLEALWPLIDKAMPVVFIANTENEIRRALNMAAEFGLRPIIAGAREGWKAAKRLHDEKVPVIVSLKWSEEPKRPGEMKEDEWPPKEPTEPRPEGLRPIFDETWEKKAFEPERLFQERVRLWQEEVDNAKVLHEAGVEFAIGSFEMKSPADLMKNLRKAIARGLTETVALAALTRDAAKLLGLSEQFGEIAPGRLANLTILDKSLADEKAKVQLIFVEGKRFDPMLSPRHDDFKGKKRDKGGSASSMPATSVASQPTSAPTSQPIDWPSYACEIEADRKPRVQTGGDLLIKHATLLTITHGDLPDTDLMIQDGKISGIGRGLTGPPAMKSVDLTGYCVMPGIIDPHSHMCSDGGLNEFSLSVTPEVRVRDVVNHMDVSAYRALAGGVTTIHTMHGSANTIGGQNATLHLKYGRPAAEWLFKEAPRTVKFALGENVKQSNFGRRGTRFPNTRAGVEAVLRRSFDAARKYKSDLETFEKDKAANKDPRPVRRDLRLEALAAIHDGAIWVHCHCYRGDEILRLLAVAEEYGFRIAVLQHVLEGYRIIPEILRHGCGASTFSDWWAYKIEAYEAIPHNAARMTQGGIVATVNSDSAELVRHLNFEAAKSLHYGGLPPNDALRLCTLNGAMQMGVDKYVGSIETGKLADLAVFDGHPLDTFSKCVMTLVDGEVFFQHESLDFDRPVPPLAAKTFAQPPPVMMVPASESDEYWIIGATIHPVSGPAIPDGLLIIAGGLIKHIGQNYGRPAPSSATVVGAMGLHVYPGLINADTQLGLMEIGSVAGSVDEQDIGDFQPDLAVLSAYNPFAGAIEVTRSAGVTAALVALSGGPVAGRAGLVHLDGWSMPEARVVSPLGLCVALPSLPIRFPDDLEEDKKKEQIDEHHKKLALIEDFFHKASRYAKAVATGTPSEKSPEYDRRFEAMIPFVRGEAPVFFRADSYKQIKEAIRFAHQYELKAVIRGGREAWKLAEELADKKIDVILGRTTSYPGDKFEPWDSIYREPAILHKHGVRFCISTGDATLAKHVGIEAGFAVAHGLDEEAALRTVTIEPARILGVDARLGSLEVGKVADVIVTSDSPLQTSNVVVAEFITGRPIDLASKHTRTDEKFQARPRPTLPPETPLRGPPAIRLTPTGG